MYQPSEKDERLGTKIGDEGGGEAWGGHGEGYELAEEQDEQQAPYILPLELHEPEHGSLGSDQLRKQDLYGGSLANREEEETEKENERWRAVQDWQMGRMQ